MKYAFDVETILERAFVQKGTLTIDRDTSTITVRVLHGRTPHVVTINDVARWIVEKSLRQEALLNAKPRKKKAARGYLSMRGR